MRKGIDMERMNHVLKYILMIFGVITILSGNSFANDSKDVALVLKSKGDVRVKKAATKKWYKGKRGYRLDSGDIIRTSSNSLAAIMFTDDKTLMKVRDNSSVAIKGKREKKSITKRIFCSVGKFWLKASKQNQEMVVETPSGVAAIKGSAALFNISGAETKIIVDEGIFKLMNKFGEILVNAGETGILTRNGEPVKYETTDDEKVELDLNSEDSGDMELKIKFKDSQGVEKELNINLEEKK